ncbi:exodeoxyribonuclease V subunit alpha [Acinetobacter larvae]|uniref:RecBCD enzyme subunit RecD n=1 Tax=Acinetobacter larvae TaxID=1789224 RepID=A0A1B2LW47_9GAMM|nr:exodeoxyribonuclease V subunit alpha [Acinetobacter larvae]AOA57172.1 exodeoxyribonuclease V subunit alpha [Acinetobacter larvae]
MENKADLPESCPAWIESWSNYLLQCTADQASWSEQTRQIIQQLLLASTQGDSCIALALGGGESLKHLLVSAQQAEQQVAPFVYDHQYLYLYRYWRLQQRLAAQITAILQQAVDAVPLQGFEDILTDPYQLQALQQVCQHPLTLITGGPGTGKTYTLARIIAVLHHRIDHLRVAMAAPTGKAAQRMKEALQASLADQALAKLGLDVSALQQQETLTIHRLLGMGKNTPPRYHRQRPLPYDVVVIDEASMLDLQLATLLFEAIPAHCRLILLGDAQQLASVDVGAVLADLQQAQCLAAYRVNLQTSRRFKGDALIGKMAAFIQAQQDDLNTQQRLAAFTQSIVSESTLQAVALSATMQDVIQLQYVQNNPSAEQLSAYYDQLAMGYQQYFQALKVYLQQPQQAQAQQAVLDAFADYRMLCAVRHGRFGLAELNRQIQNRLFQYLAPTLSPAEWYVGRPVMVTRNDAQLGLSNGDIGICLQHPQDATQLAVYFPHLDSWISAARLPQSIETAFVMTIHKSQGSEFRHVAVTFDAAAQRLLSRELLYTAITRAKSVVSLLVDAETFAQSLAIASCRQSGLVDLLDSMMLDSSAP